MTGQPKKRALVAELDARTAAMFAEDDEPGTHLDYCCAFIADGGTLRSLALDLTPAVRARWEDTEGADPPEDMEVSHGKLTRHLRATFGEEEAERRLAVARRACAHVLNEESLEIADAKPETAVDVAHAALRVKTRQWTAERFNPDLAIQKGATLNLSIGQLHLEALRAIPSRVPSSFLSPTPEPAPTRLPGTEALP